MTVVENAYLPPERYGGFWIRLLAGLLDGLIFFLVGLPFVLLAYGTDYFESDQLIEGWVDLLFGWIMPVVAEIVFWRYKRATPAKMLFRLEVVDADTGETLSWGQCILRYVGYFLAALPCGIGLIMIAFSERKQGLHDRLANSVVRKKI